jgi:hypothetical protein
MLSEHQPLVFVLLPLFVSKLTHQGMKLKDESGKYDPFFYKLSIG